MQLQVQKVYVTSHAFDRVAAKRTIFTWAAAADPHHSDTMVDAALGTVTHNRPFAGGTWFLFVHHVGSIFHQHSLSHPQTSQINCFQALGDAARMFRGC